MADAKPKFEKDLEKLEAIVGSLEEGGLSLDDSLKKFEEGIKLAKRCEKALQEAEKKIEILTKKAGGELEAQPFGEEDSDDDDGEEDGDDDEDPDEPSDSDESDEEEDEEQEGDLLF